MFALSMIAVSGSLTEVSGSPQDASKKAENKTSVPRYSDTCAHGHNGHDCKTPQFRIDISELQEKIVGLEKRISQLEKIR